MMINSIVSFACQYAPHITEPLVVTQSALQPSLVLINFIYPLLASLIVSIIVVALKCRIDASSQNARNAPIVYSCLIHRETGFQWLNKEYKGYDDLYLLKTDVIYSNIHEDVNQIVGSKIVPVPIATFEKLCMDNFELEETVIFIAMNNNTVRSYNVRLYENGREINMGSWEYSVICPNQKTAFFYHSKVAEVQIVFTDYRYRIAYKPNYSSGTLKPEISKYKPK